MASSSSTSAAHLTLEEFTSSSSPLSTILVPRSQALRLVELCELAEMTPSASFLDFIGGTNNNTTTNNGGDGEASTTTASAAEASSAGGNNNNNNNNHVLVTQMALLLYLGEYTHARHLWRRHRGSRASPEIISNSISSDHDQLEQLWNAAKYCYLWSTGGINSLTTPSSPAGDADAASTNQMQVESDSLPFSTLALRAFQSCQSSDMEPLATYSAELLGVFRSRVNRGLHESFGKLDCTEFCLRMNLESGEEDNASSWESLGWKKEGGYLVSDVDVVLDYDDDYDDEAEDAFGAGKEEDRIGKLTDIVMFLEGKMNA